MIATPGALRRYGLLGMNRRNGDFIQKYNPRRLYPLVDNKLLTKQLAVRAGIAVPKLYAVVEIQHQVRNLLDLIGDEEDFVIKPAQGSGGKGVMVVTGRSRDRFRLSSGNVVTLVEVSHHVSNILSGMHSLGGKPDIAMVEYRVKFDPLFDKLSYRGVPDIRMIVFRGLPVAAMVRLPTRMSDGKANLHQGAVGVGVDLVTGTTVSGVWRDKIVDQHPDTGAVLAGTIIPHWERLCELSARCYDLVGLGYLGCDIVLDRDLGPLVLELNARPGLNIQLADGQGLSSKLRPIAALKEIPSLPEQRAALARLLARKW